MSVYALIDCNNFFVSCERMFRPDVWHKPAAVLSNNDGCFIARSQEVKDLGVPMGAPLFKYRDIIRANRVELFSANFELYGDIAQRIVTILQEVTPLIEVYSIDECFMDLSELPVEDYQQWAMELRARILQEIGIPVSIGVAPTKTLAKVSSTFAKKHGGVWVVNEDAKRLEMLAGLPIGDVWGIGRRMTPKLLDLGFSNALQLVEADDAWIKQQFNITGVKMVDELRGIARLGFGDKHEQRKTIMRSRSFGRRVGAMHQMESAVATFAAQAASRLRAQDSVARGVVTFISTGKHAVQQASMSTLTTLPEATSDTATLIKAALSGLEAIHDPEFMYQKAGVILVDIASYDAWQLSMIGGDKNRDDKQRLMDAVDQLNKRYSKGAVWHASENQLRADWHSKKELRSPRYTTNLAELPMLVG